MSKSSSGAKFGSPTFGVRDKKCAGARGVPEFMSSPTYTRGREFMVASVYFKTVRS